MSEQNTPNQLNNNLGEEKGKENKVEEKKAEKKKVFSKKSKEKEDSYVLVMPEKVRSLNAKIANRIVEILREEPLISEKEIILKLIARDNEIKEYFAKTQDISYIRYIVWSLVKKKIILKAKILGDDKHVYFFLPEQIDSLKEKIIKAPKRTSE
uniref:ORF153b n=1 Tax=Saccharolobus islandicus TaxID=43080 RepID=Q9C4Y3_SACIS|nr:hypothetical protein [Sulfolobus islandicus]AAK06909.1 ORF153b [Sulfolobus islandicus]CAG38152.1 hypothetical protein [Sulfolobus islandicus]CAG38192.1 hypothetical protein [Sulfolobus islandicus]CDF47307.1 unnamed protein product [Sulfolobus islandicus]